MGLFSNKELEQELNKLRREVRYLKDENQKINLQKVALDHDNRIRDGIFSKKDSLNNIMLKQNKTRDLRLTDMRSNLSDVLKVAGELINYIQFMQNSFDQVSDEINNLSSKYTQAEKLSNSAKKIYEVLEHKSQEIQIALTEVADNAHKTRHIAKDAALKAAKMGQFAHEFADIVGHIKDSSDKAQINAKRAKGAFSRFTDSMESEFTGQGEVEWLTEASKDIETILGKVSEETEMKLKNLSCMVDKASNGLRKIDFEIFINQIYLTMNSGKSLTKANPGLFDASTPVSVYERHLHEDAERVADTIGDAPASLETLKAIFIQVEHNSLELFSSIDQEEHVEEKDLVKRTTMDPLEELVHVNGVKPGEGLVALMGPPQINKTSIQ